MYHINAMIMTTTGMLGGLLLALSGLPQAIKSYREGRTGDISHGLLWMWLIGEVLMFAYTLGTLRDIPLLLNFGINTLLVGVITWYRYFPRKREETHTLSVTRYMSENTEEL